MSIAPYENAERSEPPPPDAGHDPSVTSKHETPRAPRGLLAESPSWLASLALHLAVLLVLALTTLGNAPELAANLLLFESGESNLDEFEELNELLLDPVDLENEPIESEVQPETDVVAQEVSFSAYDDATAAPRLAEVIDLATPSLAASLASELEGFDGAGTAGRGRKTRTALVRRNGGSRSSEQAVANALNWIAEHQNPDGSWSLVHDRHKCRGRCGNNARVPRQQDNYSTSLISGTSLALLPFLGAGQTPEQGRYKRVVRKGLDALVGLGQKKKTRVSWADSGSLYAHGLAAIALTEAYGMTRDPSLRGPAQAAVDYIVYAQDPAQGGWRYRPRQGSDTSVTGWQIMALKSAHLADLSVDPQTVRRATKFLDLVQSRGGTRYAYVAQSGQDVRDQATGTRSAVGLLCRMYTGWNQEHEPLQAGVALLAKQGPSKNNYYYNYYAAQVLFQHTAGEGMMWRKWNRQLRDQLVDQQDQTGHAKGSWFIDGPHNTRGGRLYMTSLATMTLEVYYRYMPIYQSQAVKQQFP